MRLIDQVTDAEFLCALSPEQLGRLMLPDLATWRKDLPGQNLSLETARRRWCGDAGSPSGYAATERGRTRAAIGQAWAWLEGQGLLIEDPHHVSGNSFRILTSRAKELAAQPILEASAQLSAVTLAQASFPEDKKPEIFMLKPSYMGLGVDLKELWRRAWPWLRKRWGRQL